MATKPGPGCECWGYSEVADGCLEYWRTVSHPEEGPDEWAEFWGENWNLCPLCGKPSEIIIG